MNGLSACMLIAPSAPPRVGNGLPSRSALLASIVHHEVGVVMVWVSHLGISVDTLFVIPIELHMNGARSIVHDYADDDATVETGGLPTTADFLVAARQRNRAEANRLGADSFVGLWHSLWPPPLPIDLRH
jgi:hypothetical protein